MRYTTMADVIDREIVPALGAFAEDFDVEGLARATFTYCVDTDKDGNELLNTAGFEASAGAVRFSEAKRERQAIEAAAEHAVTNLADYRARHQAA